MASSLADGAEGYTDRKGAMSQSCAGAFTGRFPTDRERQANQPSFGAVVTAEPATMLGNR